MNKQIIYFYNTCFKLMAIYHSWKAVQFNCHVYRSKWDDDDDDDDDFDDDDDDDD